MITQSTCFRSHLRSFQTFADTFYRSKGYSIISLPSSSSHTIKPVLITVSPRPHWFCYPTSYSSCPLALSQWGNYFKLQAYSSSLKVGKWGAVIFMFTGENYPNEEEELKEQNEVRRLVKSSNCSGAQQTIKQSPHGRPCSPLRKENPMTRGCEGTFDLFKGGCVRLSFPGLPIMML